MQLYSQATPESLRGAAPGFKYSSLQPHEPRQLDANSFLSFSYSNDSQDTEALPVPSQRTSDETMATTVPQQGLEFRDWLEFFVTPNNTNAMPPSSTRRGPVPSSRLTPSYSNLSSPIQAIGAHAQNGNFSSLPTAISTPRSAAAASLHAPQAHAVSSPPPPKFLQNNTTGNASSNAPRPHRPIQPVSDRRLSYPSPTPSPVLDYNGQFTSRRGLSALGRGPSVNLPVAWTMMERPNARHSPHSQYQQGSMPFVGNQSVFSDVHAMPMNSSFVPPVQAQRPLQAQPNIYRLSPISSWPEATTAQRRFKSSEGPITDSFGPLPEMTPLFGAQDTLPFQFDFQPTYSAGFPVYPRSQDAVSIPSDTSVASASSANQKRKRANGKNKADSASNDVAPQKKTAQYRLVPPRNADEKHPCTFTVLTPDGVQKECGEVVRHGDRIAHCSSKHGTVFFDEKGKQCLSCHHPKCRQKAQTTKVKPVKHGSFTRHFDLHLGLRAAACPCCGVVLADDSAVIRHAKIKKCPIDGGQVDEDGDTDEQPQHKRQKNSD